VGQKGERFVSDSGRVVIDPNDWNLGYGSWASNQFVGDGFQLTWQIVPFFVDRVSLSPQEQETRHTITVAQGLPTGVHLLEIRGTPVESVQAVRAYSPPWV
jgi:hypothetical protein